MAGCEALGIQSDLVPDIALGLAGGIGLQGETCGVLSGCAMVLSLAVAEKEKDYPKKKMQTLQAVGRVHKAFRQRLGRADCRSLSGLDLTTPEGRKKLQEGVKEQVCAGYVRAGCELLAKELQAL
jgi:C_GCAxxG_C_C family probable redox protein